MGVCALNKNGFLLIHALLGLLILALCISLLHLIVEIQKEQGEIQIEEKIEKEWFYND